MSYEKVKRIWIDGDKVMIHSSSNNVRPLDWNKWECTPLSNILKDKGKETVELEIFKDYEGGTFQAGNQNKYTRALKVLMYVFRDEYNKFDWRRLRVEDWKPRETEEFNEFLRKVLNYKLPKTKYVIAKENNYISKVTSRRGFFTSYIEDAKKFSFREEAQEVANMFSRLDLHVVEANENGN